MESAEPKPSSARLWGPIAAILVTVGIYFLSQILVGLLLVFWPSLLGVDPEVATVWMEEHKVLEEFATMAALEGITVLLLWQFLKSRKARFSDIGLVAFKAQDIPRALVGYVAYFSFFLGLSVVLQNAAPGLDVEQQQELGYSTATSGIDLAAVFITLVILPPLVEELLFRGFLYTGLRRGLTFAPAAIITSTIFGLAHLLGGEGGSVIWIAAIDTFVLSLVLVYLREKYQTLWPAILVHMFKNGTAFAILFVFKDSF